MPRLDPKSLAVTGVHRGARALYEPIGPLPVVDCPDCGHRADAEFGDHGGECLASSKVTTPMSALGIVRRFAIEHARFSANDLRPVFDAADVAPTSRGPALGTATRRQWIEPDGSIRSTDPATKGHRVQTYRSLIHRSGKATA